MTIWENIDSPLFLFLASGTFSTGFSCVVTGGGAGRDRSRASPVAERDGGPPEVRVEDRVVVVAAEDEEDVNL